jgi:hypothetical protein
MQSTLLHPIQLDFRSLLPMRLLIPKLNVIDIAPRARQIDHSGCPSRANEIADIERFAPMIAIDNHDMVKPDCAAQHVELNRAIPGPAGAPDFVMVCGAVDMCGALGKPGDRETWETWGRKPGDRRDVSSKRPAGRLSIIESVFQPQHWGARP